MSLIQKVLAVTRLISSLVFKNCQGKKLVSISRKVFSFGVKILCAASYSPLSALDVRLYFHTEKGELFCFYTSIADVRALTVDFPLEEKWVT